LVGRRGEPAVIIMSVKDYIRNIAPTPAAYSAIRQEAKRKGAGSLSMREIDREIAAVRRARGKGTHKQPAA
jgi:PHD/YefM family antitoxin component YafN of YafNO toxin-antitoxin module